MLGELHYDYGDLNEAFRIFHEELESCTMETQVIESHLKLILVSLKRGKLEDVLQWVDKVRERRRWFYGKHRRCKSDMCLCIREYRTTEIQNCSP